jgi:hypothetical protein
MLRIEKNWRQKSVFLNFLCRESENCTWQRNSLPRANQLTLGKEIFGECFFLCRELFVWLLAKKPVCRVLFMCREPNKKLSAKSLLCREFFIWLSAQNQTLSKD